MGRQRSFVLALPAVSRRRAFLPSLRCRVMRVKDEVWEIALEDEMELTKKSKEGIRIKEK